MAAATQVSWSGRMAQLPPVRKDTRRNATSESSADVQLTAEALPVQLLDPKLLDPMNSESCRAREIGWRSISTSLYPSTSLPLLKMRFIVETCRSATGGGECSVSGASLRRWSAFEWHYSQSVGSRPTAAAGANSFSAVVWMGASPQRCE